MERYLCLFSSGLLDVAFLAVARLIRCNQILSQVSDTLKLGIDYLNLDYEIANQLLDESSHLKTSLGFDHLVKSHGDEKLLNLYTQCRVCWKIDQIANFLARMSSFYEETLNRLVIVFDGQRYFLSLNAWVLNTTLAQQEMGESLWQSFDQARGNYNFRRDANGNLKLDNRFSRSNFIEKILVPHRKVSSNQWDIVFDALKQLDFWVTQRNQMIHSAEGVSKERMKKLFLNYTREDRLCAPEQIRNVMAKICSSELRLVRDEYREKFVGNKADFYLYSNITSWVRNQLQAESSK